MKTKKKITKTSSANWKQLGVHTFKYEPKGKAKKQLSDYLASLKAEREAHATRLKELAIYVTAYASGLRASNVKWCLSLEHIQSLNKAVEDAEHNAKQEGQTWTHEAMNPTEAIKEWANKVHAKKPNL